MSKVESVGNRPSDGELLYRCSGYCIKCSIPGESEELTRHELPVDAELFDRMSSARLQNAYEKEGSR